MTTLDTSKLRQALERHAELSEKKLHGTYPHVTKWFKTRGLQVKHIRHQAGKLASASALAGAMFLSNPLLNHLPKQTEKLSSMPADQLQDIFRANLNALLPSHPRPLTPDEEDAIEKLVHLGWNIPVKARLDGEHLNTTYGYIGAEQHLPRYPGDTMEPQDAYRESGITPGRGAWSYFAPSKAQMTQDLYEKEKYYVAVQTLYLPDWEERLSHLREWYKYRKVMVMNPKNGKAIIAVVADAGPAKFTGKSFGGSPEVMHYLESKDGAQKGPVVILFVDDPNNTIPLGPVKKETHTALAKEAK